VNTTEYLLGVRLLTANGLSFVSLHHGALLHRGFLLMSLTALSGAEGAVEAQVQ
jgi:hypothetical protein